MKEIHLEKGEKLKTNEKENHIKIFGKLTRTDFRILKKLKVKHIDLSSTSDETFPSFQFPPKLKKFKFFPLYDSLTSIVLPDNTHSIKKRAFYSCKALESIDMPRFFLLKAKPFIIVSL